MVDFGIGPLPEKDRLTPMSDNRERRKFGPFWVEWIPGAPREWLYSQYLRREGLEALWQVEGHAIVRVHASPWRSRRALCGISGVKVRRGRAEWGNEIPEGHWKEYQRSRVMASLASSRCPRCLDLAPLDTLP